MARKERRQKLTILLCFLILFLPLFVVRAEIILSDHKFAWSNNVGYINFGNVTVSDGVLDGSAWSANKGFINFSPAQGGVFNDGTGNLSGSAWGEQLGYIDFNNVTINGATGKFSGTATGTLVGTITFDCPNFCDVETDWRSATPPTPPAPSPSPSQNNGGSRSINPPPSEVPALPDTGPVESTQAKPVDIQKDGIINILDFNTLMVNWGSAVCGNPADMNNDCTVGIFDFNLLMVNWGNTYQL